MKIRIFWTVLMVILASGLSKAQSVEDSFYTYVTMDEPFDILVFQSVATDSDCSRSKEQHYGAVIGNAVVGDRLEPLTILVKCLPVAIEKGEVVTIKPIKTPKKSLAYQTASINGDPTTNEVIGARFSALWGEIIP